MSKPLRVIVWWFVPGEGYYWDIEGVVKDNTERETRGEKPLSDYPFGPHDNQRHLVQVAKRWYTTSSIGIKFKRFDKPPRTYTEAPRRMH